MGAWAVLLLALAVPSGAFVLMGENLTTVDGKPVHLPGRAYRWSIPANTISDEGLGGGIAWVMDPRFCDDIIGRFPEESVVRGL